MALGISKRHYMVEYSIPLKMNDRLWVVEHLRALADKIENNPSSIMSVEIQLANGHVPSLAVLQADNTLDYPIR